MSLPSYLIQLNQYPDFVQLQRCAELAKNTFHPEHINQELLDGLRGHLLRTLDEVSRLIIKQQGIYNLLSTYASRFFNAKQAKGNLNYCSAQALQEIRKTLIIALQGLANHYPISNVDPIDLNSIDDDQLCFTSLMGRRYRLENIVAWILVRKEFIYPDTNSRMLDLDVAQLKQLCAQHNLSLHPKPGYIVELEQELLTAGFSVDDIKTLKVPNLRKNHINVLKVLVTDYRLNHAQAIAELNGLNYEQADALNTLYAHGLRGEHLRNLAIAEDEFGPHHTVVLAMLINDWHYDVDTAIACISECDLNEIQKFYSMPAPKF